MGGVGERIAGPPGPTAMPGLVYTVGDGAPADMGVSEGVDGGEPGIAYAVGVGTLGDGVGLLP